MCSAMFTTTLTARYGGSVSAALHRFAPSKSFDVIIVIVPI